MSKSQKVLKVFGILELVVAALGVVIALQGGGAMSWVSFGFSLVTAVALLQAAKDIVSEKGLTFANLRAWDGYKDQLAFRATPTTYFIDSQGRLIGDPILGANVIQYRKNLDDFIKTIQ